MKRAPEDWEVLFTDLGRRMREEADREAPDLALPPPRRRFVLVGLAALATGLLAGLGYTMLMTQEPPNPDPPPAPSTALERLDRSYGGLDRAISSGVLPRLPAEARPAFLETLRDVDRGILLSRQAVMDHPRNPAAWELCRSAYEAKARLIEISFPR